jgi:hypothetical protein
MGKPAKKRAFKRNHQCAAEAGINPLDAQERWEHLQKQQGD